MFVAPMADGLVKALNVRQLVFESSVDSDGPPERVEDSQFRYSATDGGAWEVDSDVQCVVFVSFLRCCGRLIASKVEQIPPRPHSLILL